MLTTRQSEIVDRLTEWMLDSDDTKPFYILGFAGTGKTYIINYMLNHLNTNMVCVAAPTNKAKSIIYNGTKIENMEYHTIHSLLSMVMTDFGTEKKMSSPNDTIIKNFNMVIVDELSMISPNLHNVVCEFAKQFKIKLIFMGDMYQLLSPDMSKVKMQVNGHIERLTELKRQNMTNPNVELYLDILNNFSIPYNVMRLKTNMSNGEGYAMINPSNLNKVVEKLFTSEASKSDPNHARLITYTNSSVDYWNSYIRNTKGYTMPLVVGESLTGYNTIHDEDSIFIMNGCNYIIKDIREGITPFGLDVFHVELANANDGKAFEASILMMNEENVAGYIRNWSEFVKKISDAPYERLKMEYAASLAKFKKSHLLLNDIKLNGGKKIDADLKYGYAETVYKSQGSTYNMSLIDYGNMSTCNEDLKNRMIYTALTRARKLNFIYFPY